MAGTIWLASVSIGSGCISGPERYSSQGFYIKHSNENCSAYRSELGKVALVAGLRSSELLECARVLGVFGDDALVGGAFFIDVDVVIPSATVTLKKFLGKLIAG